MATSRDVARLAGVSQATVSRVLTSRGKVSEATRAKVEAAQAALGYVPHAGAQAMKTQRTHSVGLVVANLMNPFYSELLDAVTRELDAAGYRVLIWNAESASRREAIAAINERAVDGVLFSTATERLLELQAAVDKGRPIVLINRDVPFLKCDTVTSANYAGGRLVADLIVGSGRRRIAHLGGPQDASTFRNRTHGFLESLARAGVVVPADRIVKGLVTHDDSQAAMLRLLERDEPPDAIFCGNDYLAYGVMDALRMRGIEPGEDCWVIGYDDIAPSAWKSYDLTTIRQPTLSMARAGVAMLLARIDAPRAPAQHLEFPCELVVRATTPGVVAPPSEPGAA